MEENLALASDLLTECSALDIILELEIGIVGGVEDAMDNEDIDRAKLYTSPEDMVRTAEVLGTGDRGTYLLKRLARGKDDPFKVAFCHNLQLYLASRQ